MPFASAMHVQVTRYLPQENREESATVLAGSWKDAIQQVDDGRECTQVLMVVLDEP